MAIAWQPGLRLNRRIRTGVVRLMITSTMEDSNPKNTSRAPLPIGDLRQRLNQLRWLVPLGLLALVILYEAWPARWLHDTYGYRGHLLGAVAVYGTVG